MWYNTGNEPMWLTQELNYCDRYWNWTNVIHTITTVTWSGTTYDLEWLFSDQSITWDAEHWVWCKRSKNIHETRYHVVVGRLIELVDHYSLWAIQFDNRYFFLYSINQYRLLSMCVILFKDWLTYFSSHFLNCSMLFTDNQSHSLICKHFGSVEKDKCRIIKGFLRMSKLIYCKNSKG